VAGFDEACRVTLSREHRFPANRGPLGEELPVALDVYSPNAIESILCPVADFFTGKSVSGHVLAGHALALEHEVLAEGRRGRLISGVRAAVQRLLRGPEGCDRRPDKSRFRPM
jgi:hypothetical protein